MYNVSEAYRAHIANSTVRLAHSKIVVDGVEYTGRDHLKKYPSISCTGEFIGSFPAKECTFEMFVVPGLDLVGKEIAVYRGLEIDGVTEWVPLGLFTAAADGVKTSNSGDSITYTGYDRAARFDVEYTALDITYPVTIGVFAQEMAFRRNVDFDTTPFPCCDVILESAPNIPAGTTEREVIRHIAELGGANAWISRDGALCIQQPRPTTETIPKRKYTSLSSKEAVFGGINTVVLGKTDYDDDIVYRDADLVAANGVIEWRLENNIFADADRAAFAEYIGQSYIIGMTYTPFEVTGLVDDWYLDVFDTVQVQDKSGEYFTTVILSYATADRIKSNISASVPGEMLTNYEIAGTTQKKLRYVQLQVDHVNNKIESVAADVATVGDTVTELKSTVTQTADAITQKVSYGDVISSINQTAEEITIDAKRLNLNGYVTISDLGADGETVIHGGRIDTDSLYVRYLEGAEGNFKSLTAAEGGTIQIGKCEFLDDGLEYDNGVFDLQYNKDSGIVQLSGTAPMLVGPYRGGVTNYLSLYGTYIEFGVSTSEFYAIMDTVSGYSEICFRPYKPNTGNIGTASHSWDSGHFRNLHVYNDLNIDGLSADTLNISGAARVNGTMVIGNASVAQPSTGLYVTGALYASGQLTCNRAIVSAINTASDTADYATDKVVTVGASSGRLYKTGVPLSRLYDVVGTSTRKSKYDIAPLGSDFDIFDELQPIQFVYNHDEKNGRKSLGLLAEDLESLAPDLCYYGDTGELEGIKYNSIIALLIREIQTLKERIKQYDTKID